MGWVEEERERLGRNEKWSQPTIVERDRLGCKGMVGKDRPHSSGGTVFGGPINLKIRGPLTQESCLSLPSVQGCLCSPLRDLCVHCPQDDSTGEILFDEVFHTLSRCLRGLLRPFRVPGSCIDFQPEIYVTIQAYSSIIGLQSHQVLHPFSKFVPSDLISGSPYPEDCPKSPALLAS